MSRRGSSAGTRTREAEEAKAQALFGRLNQDFFRGQLPRYRVCMGMFCPIEGWRNPRGHAIVVKTGIVTKVVQAGR